MSEVKIKELDKSLIHQANSNSMSGQRGDISAHEYEVYCQKVMSWNIPDSRKQKIVDQIYAKWSEQLRHEAAHVSVAVAGPARYNAKKLDHSDTILRLSSEFVEWFNGLQEQVWQGRIEDKDAKEIARLVDDIKFCIERTTLNPTASLCELANKAPEPCSWRSTAQRRRKHSEKLPANCQQVEISLRETAHREVMERAARGPRTALPSQWLLRNTRSGKNGARKSCMRGSGSTTGGHRRQAWNSLFMSSTWSRSTRRTPAKSCRQRTRSPRCSSWWKTANCATPSTAQQAALPTSEK